MYSKRSLLVVAAAILSLAALATGVIRSKDAAADWALPLLPPEHRAVLTLGDMEGLGYEELAEVLDCPLGTVRSRLFRARAAFKKVLLRQGREVLEP